MQCRICGGSLDIDDAVNCTRCSAAFHSDCWTYNEGCGIFGCGCKVNTAFVPSEIKDVGKIDELTGPISPWSASIQCQLNTPSLAVTVAACFIVTALPIHYFLEPGIPLDPTAFLMWLFPLFCIAFSVILLAPHTNRNPLAWGISCFIVGSIPFTLLWPYSLLNALAGMVTGFLIFILIIGCQCLSDMATSRLIPGVGTVREVTRLTVRFLIVSILLFPHSFVLITALGQSINLDLGSFSFYARVLKLSATIALFIMPPIELSKWAAHRRSLSETVRKRNDAKKAKVLEIEEKEISSAR